VAGGDADPVRMALHSGEAEERVDNTRVNA
jgi:hypothetical protein